MPRPDQLASEIEKLFGKVASDALAGTSGIEEDPLLLQWVQRMGAQVSAHSDRKELPPTWTILGSDVANALTLPGSKIFVTRGLLDDVMSEDELAGILAHEAAHVAKRHAWQQLVGNATFLLALNLIRPKSRDLRLGATIVNILRSLSQSRTNEFQADEVGVCFASAAGYHPEGLLRFLERLASRPTPWWEVYFATHPPGEKRIDRGRHLPLLETQDLDSRASVAAGFDARQLPALAELARQGRDPLALAPLVLPPLVEDLIPERDDIRHRAENQLKRLLSTYRPLATAGTLQQILLFTAQTSDIRFVALATHAYLLQFKIQDVYSRAVRLLRAAPLLWDGLAPNVTDTEIDGRLGRGEVLQCLLQIEGAPDPLRRATEASLVALTDLNVGRFYRSSGSGQWARIAAIEGLIQYAERELVRADKAANIAWRYLSTARIRNYRTRLNTLVPKNDPQRRARWRALTERRLGGTISASGSTGEATIRAALALSRNRTEDEIERGRGTSPWADWVARSGGMPENVATMLRLLTLELERELAATTFLKQDSHTR